MDVSDKAVRNYVHKLSFKATDAMKAARYGFGARNIWAFWKGLVTAWFVWAFFVYLGFFAAGDSLANRFSVSGLVPLPDLLFLQSTPARILLLMGTLLALLIVMATSFKVSRLTFEQLRGDQFYSEGDAAGLFRANWKPVVATPAVIVLGLFAGMALMAVPGVLGRIPGAGPYLLSLFSLPAWMLGLFVVYAGFILVLSLFLVPPITASTGGDTFECLFELFSIVSSRPLLIIRSVIAGTFVRLLALFALILISWCSMNLAGLILDRAAGIGGTSLVMESGVSAVAPELVPFYSSFFSPVASTGYAQGSWEGIPRAVLSLSGAAVFLLLASYWFSSCTAMWTITYLSARYSRDGEDLLLRAEEEEYREFRRVYGSTDHAGDRKAP